MQYDTLASPEIVTKAIAGLKERGIEGEFVQTKGDALERIKSLIPQGASVMSGASRTLEEIGFIDHLKSGTHGWNNFKDVILAEKDPAKQAELRKQSVLSDYYLGSVHALTESGEMVIASNTGSQLPHLVYTSQNLILIVSTKKIVPDMNGAMGRLHDYVFPLEDARMKSVGVAAGSYISKVLIFNREAAFNKRSVRVIFVNERLGF